MDISYFVQEYKTSFDLDLGIVTRSRSKVKGHPYPFRDPTEFVISYHAQKRMQERSVAIPDVAFILKYGRALPLERNGRVAILIFLCPGELPKGKTKQKLLARLKGVALEVKAEQPVVITVLNRWFLWRKLIYKKTAPGKTVPHDGMRMIHIEEMSNERAN